MTQATYQIKVSILAHLRYCADWRTREELSVNTGYEIDVLRPALGDLLDEGDIVVKSSPRGKRNSYAYKSPDSHETVMPLCPKYCGFGYALTRVPSGAFCEGCNYKETYWPACPYELWTNAQKGSATKHAAELLRDGVHVWTPRRELAAAMNMKYVQMRDVLEALCFEKDGNDFSIYVHKEFEGDQYFATRERAGRSSPETHWAEAKTQAKVEPVEPHNLDEDKLRGLIRGVVKDMSEEQKINTFKDALAQAQVEIVTKITEVEEEKEKPKTGIWETIKRIVFG